MAAIQIELDALSHETASMADPELDEHMHAAREALNKSHAILHLRGFYLQVPHDYKPPEALVAGDKKKPK